MKQPFANTEELLKWAADTIKDWEDHEQYRALEWEKEIWMLDGWGSQPQNVWIARGIIEAIGGEGIGECRIVPFLEKAA